jgi:hypothetical protein
VARVIVCGGRDWTDRAFVYRCLDAFHDAVEPIAVLADGDYRGVDHMARDWAAAHGVERVPYPADWTRFGPSAGPLRNRRMLSEFAPDYVLAFPGGDGTADMVRIARQALSVGRVIKYRRDLASRRL